MDRFQKDLIVKDLERKIVILSGPRQVGKTWLSKNIGQSFLNPVYLNYDAIDHRNVIEARSWLPKTDLLVLDELHKMDHWKSYLKGIYDTKEDHLSILVTGSARLETFRGAGDSLAGRYFHHQLLPLSLAEIPNARPTDLDDLLSLGEFPEPFLSSSLPESARWRLQYIDGLIREDILDFEKVHDFKKIQLTLDLLRKRVGSPLSYKSIADDISASPNTVKRYVEIFEALFIIFRVTPYSKNIARSLLKEPKIYFYDTGMVDGDDGVKFENHVAMSLLKHLKMHQEKSGKRAELMYLRTKERKEIDFCRVLDGQIFDACEVKLSDSKISKNIKFFKERYSFPMQQIVKNLRVERVDEGIEVRRGFDFLRSLANGP